MDLLLHKQKLQMDNKPFEDIAQRILQILPNAAIGGSLALNKLDIIRRPIGDIDIVLVGETTCFSVSKILIQIPNSVMLFGNSLDDCEFNEEDFINCQKENLSKPQCRIAIEGIKVCFFAVPNRDIITIDGLRYDNPKYAIIAKANYIKNSNNEITKNKHQEDISAFIARLKEKNQHLLSNNPNDQTNVEILTLLDDKRLQLLF